MQNRTENPHRTIGMTAERANQVASAAAYLGVSGERFIQCAISAALLSLAGHDKILAALFMRAGGADWATIELVANTEVMSKIAP
jgi:hypothetical protein